jgi:hypothetical protein
VGVKNIKDLTSLTSLNLSQNGHITDNALQHLSGTGFLMQIQWMHSLTEFWAKF